MGDKLCMLIHTLLHSPPEEDSYGMLQSLHTLWLGIIDYCYIGFSLCFQMWLRIGCSCWILYMPARSVWSWSVSKPNMPWINTCKVSMLCIRVTHITWWFSCIVCVICKSHHLTDDDFSCFSSSYSFYSLFWKVILMMMTFCFSPSCFFHPCYFFFLSLCHNDCSSISQKLSLAQHQPQTPWAYLWLANALQCQISVTLTNDLYLSVKSVLSPNSAPAGQNISKFLHKNSLDYGHSFCTKRSFTICTVSADATTSFVFCTNSIF